MQFQRYAVYFAPPPGPLADFGAAWLGWDMVSGCAVDHPDLPGLPLPVSEITQTPRKYGLHATIKPPFRLADGKTEDELFDAFDILTRRTLHPVHDLTLSLTPLGRFLALTTSGNQAQLSGFAAMAVELLDPFRAPASEAELARRRASHLTERQDLMLTRWGYPYVMEDFRFHITLTGKLPKPVMAKTRAVLDAALTNILPNPFQIEDLCLVGEDEMGRFHLIHRQTLPS